MPKKIFVVESEKPGAHIMISTMLNYLELLNKSSDGDKRCTYRAYDNISDAFSTEYGSEFIDTLFKNRHEDYDKVFNSGIPIENIKNHIISNIKNGHDYGTELSDAIYYELCELESELGVDDGVEKFNKKYEFRKNELGDSFLIFK